LVLGNRLGREKVVCLFFAFWLLLWSGLAVGFPPPTSRSVSFFSFFRPESESFSRVSFRSLGVFGVGIAFALFVHGQETHPLLLLCEALEGSFRSHPLRSYDSLLPVVPPFVSLFGYGRDVGGCQMKSLSCSSFVSSEASFHSFSTIRAPAPPSFFPISFLPFFSFFPLDVLSPFFSHDAHS